MSAAQFRLITWNLHSLRDEPAEVVRNLRELEPDVVCLQEVPRFVLPASRLRIFARRCGLSVAAYDRRAWELAVLVGPGVEVVAGRAERLTRTPGLHRRGVAMADLNVGGSRCRVASVHLGLRGDERERHVAELFSMTFAGWGDPNFPPWAVAGDINEEPGAPAWEALADRLPALDHGPTYSARTPSTRIDGIFVDPRIEVVEARVPVLVDPWRATDHLPVLADLRI